MNPATTDPALGAAERAMEPATAVLAGVRDEKPSHRTKISDPALPGTSASGRGPVRISQDSAGPQLPPVCVALRNVIAGLHSDFVEVVWLKQEIASHGTGPRKISSTTPTSASTPNMSIWTSTAALRWLSQI